MRSAASIPARKQLRLRLLQLLGGAPIRTSTRPVRSGRVVVIRPDHIGDVLLSAQAVATLRASLPDARLTYLVGPWSLEAARHGPAVDEVRTLPFPGFTRRSKANALAPYVTLARYATELRREGFEMAVVLRPDHWWGALLALAASIPIRVGTETPETKPLLTHRYPNAGEPAAEHALGVARLAIHALGAEPRDLPPVGQFVTTERWVTNGNRIIGIHPSAGAPLKSWPLTRWAALADALAAEAFSVVLIGAPDDRALLESIRAQTRSCPTILSGQSLEKSAAIYASCALVITVDSGAGHLAAAVGTSTVRLYGPAPPGIFGPYPPRTDQHVLLARDLACVPCGDLESPPCGARENPACMLALGVEDVMKAVRTNLSQS